MNKNRKEVKLKSSAAAVITAAALAASSIGGAFAPAPDISSVPNTPPAAENHADNNGVSQAAAAGVFWMESVSSSALKFVNKVHGYSIEVPSDMHVTDMSSSETVSVFEDSHRRLEIYKDTNISTKSYLNYTYIFLNNTKDHTNEYSETVKMNGYEAHIKQWSRKKLTRIENDKNYYASIDIISGKNVYNLFFTSDIPFYKCGGYMDIVNSFRLTDVTVKGVNTKGKRVEKKNWNEETQEFYDKFYSDDSSLVWGIYEPAAPHYMNNLQDVEYKVNYKFKYNVLYSIILDEYDSFAVGYGLETAYKQERIVELTLQTPNTDMDENMVYRVLDGDYDTFLHDYAKSVADFGHPVLFRPFNEMNGDWCNYSAYATSRDTQIFCELYKYVYEIFQEEGADKNTIWVWNPNGQSFPNYSWNHMTNYYPGDKYADLVGITGYNTGTYYSSEKWQTFTEIYDPIYKETTQLYSQPLIITEFSCSSVGGDKAAWIKDMFEQIGKYDRIKTAIWWDGCDFDADGNLSRPYFIDETPEVISTFWYYLWRYDY